MWENGEKQTETVEHFSCFYVSVHSRLHHPSTSEILGWRPFDWQLIWVGNQLLRPTYILQQPPTDPQPLPSPLSSATSGLMHHDFKSSDWSTIQNTSKPESMGLLWSFSEVNHLRLWAATGHWGRLFVCLFAARLSACRSRSFGTNCYSTSDLRTPTACRTCSDVPFVQPFCTLQLFLLSHRLLCLIEKCCVNKLTCRSVFGRCSLQAEGTEFMQSSHVENTVTIWVQPITSSVSHSTHPERSWICIKHPKKTLERLFCRICLAFV